MSTQAECPSELLSAAVVAIQANAERGLARVDALLDGYPRDPKLHFLRGSLLASAERYPEARSAMARAVELAPDFALGRFQLGFLELTSGDAAAAQETWAPLSRLPPDDSLGLFARGLCHLIRDEFTDAVALLTQGIALNSANPPLNADMRLIIDKIAQDQAGAPPDAEPISPAHLLLQQYSNRTTKH